MNSKDINHDNPHKKIQGGLLGDEVGAVDAVADVVVVAVKYVAPIPIFCSTWFM